MQPLDEWPSLNEFMSSQYGALPLGPELETTGVEPAAQPPEVLDIDLGQAAG